MDIEKLAEKIRDIVLGEIKDEFKIFRASVTGELSGFRLALESINARQTNIENEMRDLRRAIEETNKKIDDVKDYLLSKIEETNKRIDETNNRIDKIRDYLISRIDDVNKRLDTLYLEVSEMRAELKKAISDKEIIHDMLFRIERLESKISA